MQTCLRPSWNVTKFCEQHFKAWTPLTMLVEPKELALLQDHLQTAFSAQWKPSCNMRMVLNLRASILAGKIQSSRLRFLDLEYSPRTGRVHEVGMCDATGKKTIDCLTRLSATELARTSLPVDKNTRRIEYLHETAVERHGSSDGTLMAHQIADKLKSEGITPETVFVVWATNKKDLKALREWLEAEGHHGILPGDSKCIPVITDFRANLTQARLSNGRVFPLTLPIAFPAFFGIRHPLCGRNHQAIVDTLQLWLMIEAFSQLCMPPSSREDWLTKLGNMGTWKRQETLENSWAKSRV
jgi:hypothetical protein